MRNYLLLALAFLIHFNSFSQVEAPKIKFGKVSEEELLMKSYDKDTSANAVVLFNSGRINFQYQDPNGFQFVYNEHIRIKVFNKNAFNWADHSISLYNSGTSEEKLVGFKAITYNLEDGEIVKDKIKSRDIMYEEFNKNRQFAKFTMPNVKEGSVLDIEITIRSDYLYDLRSWRFQYDIPVVWSEFYATIPSYFNYKHYFKGYNNLVINDTKGTIKEDFTINYEELDRAGKVIRGSYKISPVCNIYNFAAKDIPAFKEEPFMASSENYIFKLIFELSFTKFPNSTLKNYAKTWESTDKELLENTNFGDFINTSRITKSIIEDLSIEGKSEIEKLSTIFNYVQNNYIWDKRYRIYANKNHRQLENEKTGTSADINLFLVSLLKEAGINSYPILLSTRSNGMIVPSSPGVNSFNYAVAYAIIENEGIVLDATDDFSKPNLLPTRCLNGKARIISKNNLDWIDLTPKQYSTITRTGNFDITETGMLKGELIESRNNYYEYTLRKTLSEYDDVEDYMNSYKEENHAFEVIDYEFNGTDNIYSPLESKLDLEIVDGVNVINDMIIFDPMNFYTREGNPFKAEKRSYPIQFMYPTQEIFNLNYKIPEGYKVEEIPSDLEFELPDKSAKFSYKISQNGDIIQLRFKKEIGRTIYLMDEYYHLRDLFNKMISKEAEKIILKKLI